MKKWISYKSILDIKVDPEIKYIWLASWYPSKTDEFNGDFIQRHAESVSLFEKIIVIHIIYKEHYSKPYFIDLCCEGNLTEVILYIGIRGRITDFSSIFQYNFRYHFDGFLLIKKVILQIKKPLLIHVHVPIKMGRLAWVIHKFYKIPYIISEHSGKYATYDIDSFEKRNLFYRISLKKILKGSTAVIHVSNFMTDIFSNLFALKKQHIIRNVVDERYFHFAPIVHDRYTFIHVSNLDPVKNFDGIITAFDILFQKRQDFRLIVIGNQGHTDIHSPSFLMKHPFLEVKGTMAYMTVANFMNSSDCLILFSHNENFPCVMIEALCCGLPVITTDVGGCKEAIDDNNGLLIEKADLSSLIEAMEYMMDHKEMYDREKISLKSISKYNRKQIGKEFLRLYNEFSF